MAQRVDRYRGGRQRSQPGTIPAPIDGINATAALAAMSPLECIYSYNMLPKDSGMEVRKGSVEYANGWTGTFARSIVAFEGQDSSNDRLWVCNTTGIWDVTTDGETSPTQDVTFATTTGNAGIVSYVQFSTDGDEELLLLCDGANGYYTWTRSTDTWAKIATGAGATQIDNVDPVNFDFVTIWKKRVWFIEAGKSSAWYLAPGAAYGAAIEFNFADQFRFGGALRAIHNWTLDAGDGIDDKLVAISGGGDVCVYTGTDPAAVSSFELQGTWYVGAVPAGRRIATEHAGDLFILSRQGLMALSRLTQGMTGEDASITHKISPYIREVLDNELTTFGWDVHVDMTENLLTINTPARSDNTQQQNFQMYLGRGSWGIVRDLPIANTTNWQGEVYWTDNVQLKVFKKSGNIDQVYLNTATDGEAVAIDWQLLTAYQDFGSSAAYKRLHFIRPIFSSDGAEPGINVRAYYNYDLSAISEPPTLGADVVGTWNTDLWGSTIWGGALRVSEDLKGGAGMGRHCAVNIRGRTGDITTLLAFDIVYDTGGLL